MKSNEKNKDKLIKAISKIVGVRESRIKDYSETNDVENLIKRPKTMNLTKDQLDKIKVLNDFIINYNVTRQFSDENRIVFKDTKDIGKYFQNLIGDRKDREIFMCAFLDKNNQLIRTQKISEGTLGAAVIFPRELVKEAINSKCKSVVFSHNHPSGVSEPSKEDIALTQNYINIFKPLGINVLDHLIVGEDISSLRDRGDIYIEKDFEFRDDNKKEKSIGEQYYDNHKTMLGLALSKLSGIEASKIQIYMDEVFNHSSLSYGDNMPNKYLEPEMIKENEIFTDKEYSKLIALKDFIENYKVHTNETNRKNKVDGPLKMTKIFNERISSEEEGIYLMLFNTKIGLMGIEKVSGDKEGKMTINQKEIFLKTLSYDASSVSLIHLNNTNKNKAFALGKDVAQNVFNMLGPLQLKILDYVLVNDTSYISMKEKGLMPYTVIGAAEYNTIEIISEKSNENKFYNEENKYPEMEDEELEDEWELDL